MTNELSRILKPPSAPLREAVILAVAKCAQHFRVEVNEADYEIFCHALRDVEAWRIEKAFERCLNECQFMPKLADVWAKMPEAEPQADEGILGRFPAEEWTECGYRFRGDPKGYRVVIGTAKRLEELCGKR